MLVCFHLDGNLLLNLHHVGESFSADANVYHTVAKILKALSISMNIFTQRHLALIY